MGVVPSVRIVITSLIFDTRLRIQRIVLKECNGYRSLEIEAARKAGAGLRHFTAPVPAVADGSSRTRGEHVISERVVKLSYEQHPNMPHHHPPPCPMKNEKTKN